MNDPLFDELREKSWRRKLTASEEAELRAWLAAHPEAQGEWELEAALNDTLSRLPDAPLSSNFTAQVLRAVDRDAALAGGQSESKWKWSWHKFLPRTALAGVALALGLVGHQQYQARQLARLANNVATVSKVAAMSDPALFEDFDTIRLLSRLPPPDEGPDRDLIAYLKPMSK
jgi:anti-sigma factor RsiW